MRVRSAGWRVWSVGGRWEISLAHLPSFSHEGYSSHHRFFPSGASRDRRQTRREAIRPLHQRAHSTFRTPRFNSVLTVAGLELP
jgi:hypothetical protein